MPVLDPMQIARDACADVADANGEHLTAESYRKGAYDGGMFMLRALRAAELAVAAALAAATARRAVYEQKREAADPFAPDDRNHHEQLQTIVEALAIVENEFGAGHDDLTEIAPVAAVRHAA